MQKIFDIELGLEKNSLDWQESKSQLIDWLPKLGLPVGILCCYDANVQVALLIHLSHDLPFPHPRIDDALRLSTSLSRRREFATITLDDLPVEL